MSVAGNDKMGTPFFHELKKQASFFLREKIKNARLALTDVTPAELLTEEATNGNPWAPDTRTMGLISRAAFEIDDYWRIVEILHKRLSKFDKKYWRESYKALILLEHLLTHGPESIAPEFQVEGDVIQKLGSFQYIDERGFNWGLTVRKKSEKILQLLEKGQLLKEERARARELTRGIEGFGSFNQRPSSSVNGSFKESNGVSYGRSNSYYSESDRQEENGFPRFDKLTSFDTNRDAENHKLSSLDSVNEAENSNKGNLNILQIPKSKDPARQPLKENVADRSLKKKVIVVPVRKMSEEHHLRDNCKESKPLLGGQTDESNIEFTTEDHPFNNSEQLPTASLLSVS
ncbi:ENTH domain-containing protein C794.11c [Aristolochia californica]|uniref:ENTH domain-containing protein C794.11c n=1 Tax=Aristolochia californica TaxID=171875 RepID=UPI0035D80002